MPSGLLHPGAHPSQWPILSCCPFRPVAHSALLPIPPCCPFHPVAHSTQWHPWPTHTLPLMHSPNPGTHLLGRMLSSTLSRSPPESSSRTNIFYSRTNTNIQVKYADSSFYSYWCPLYPYDSRSILTNFHSFLTNSHSNSHSTLSDSHSILTDSRSITTPWSLTTLG